MADHSSPTGAADDRELMELLLAEEAADRAPRLAARSPGEPLTMSYAQQRMWFLQTLDPASPAYNIAVAVKLDGPLDLELLAAAVNDLVARHEVLRTSFGAEDGRAAPRLVVDVVVPIMVNDFEGFPRAERVAKVSRWLAAEAGRPFDLAQPPLLRMGVARLGPAEHHAVLVMHHIISDGWSMEVLVRELGTAYAARLEGHRPEWPELPVQYADFAAWQRAWLDGGGRSGQLEYWRGQLADLPVLALPTDRPRPARDDFAGAAVTFMLPADVAAGVRRLAREEDATVFMVLLAAFQTLLHRQTAQDDLGVGVPVANRTRSELEPLIGFFVNTLVLRADFSTRPDFKTLLRQVRRTALEAYAHQDLPFEQLVVDLQVEREPGQNPLFQVMFSVLPESRDPLRMPDLALASLPLETTTAKFDLLLALEEGPAGIGGALEYRTALFEPATIRRWTEQFCHLLREAVTAPATTVSALRLQSAAADETVLREWNATARDYPQRGIAELFAEQAAQNPRAVAVRYGEAEMTYAQLDARANQLAQWLRVAGVDSEVCVGVCLERSLELIVALLGIVKAGGAYVALDPEYPPARLQLMIEDTGTGVVVTTERLARHLPDFGRGSVICLDREAAKLAAQSATDPQVRGSLDHLAYVSFTSGSTGRPKGVAIPQRGVVRLVRNTDYAVLAAEEIFLQLAPVAFDASTFEIWAPLLNGGRLVLMPAGVPSLEELGQTIRREGVTTIFLTTGLFNALVEERLDDLRGLRQLLTGGEVCSVPHLRKAFHGLPGCRLIHCYGPTENTTFTTGHTVQAGDLEEATVPIGRPIANTTVYVLDEAMRPLPVGVPGELFTGGAGVGRGYLARPDLTAEKFVADPYAPRESGARLYRTGDRVRWRADGAIEFIGRRDQQVKIRGHRIEPAEAEAALMAEPGVKAAVAVVREETGRKRLIAYAVGGFTGEELRTRLRERLPEYLVPAVIVILDALPLTANGKVNRAALPAPGAGADEPATPVPPRDERENLIAAVWRGVLGLESVGVHDNYFAVGGDSISAIQVASRLQRAGWQVAVRDLFQHPTIAALAPRLERAGAAAANETITGSVPLTPAQAWFFAHHRENRHHFNQAVLLQPRAPLAADAVAAVIAAIWRHHDALRTVFEGENARVLGPALPPVFSEVSVADEVARLAHSESVQRGFDLARGPLFAAVLYRGPQGDRLLLAAHHLVIDGVSWRIVLEDLELGMRQQAAGQPIDLGPKTASIRQWGEAAVGRARAALAESDARYWAAQAQVPSADASELRADARDCYGTARVKAAKLSVDLTRALLTTAHAAYHTEINDLLLVAFGRALQRWRGGAGTLITMEGHGRDPETGLPPVERTVGWFTCLYPVLLTLAGDDLGAQVKHVKETLRAVPAKGIDFGLRTYLAPREAATLAPAPAARISFNYLGQFGEESGGRFAFADEPTGAPIGPHVIRAHELEAGAIVVRGQLALSLTYPPERDATGAMTRLLAGWAGELETVIAHCAGRRTEEKTPADFTSRLFTLPGYEAFLRARNWPAHAVEDVCRLSPLQAGLLFESVFDGASPAYCVQMSYRLRGWLAPDPWVRAWHELAQRHTTLRANFIHAGVDEPFQIVWKERAVEVTMTDLRGVDAAEQAARIAAARAADLARGFDLERDALWRVSGWQTTDDSFEIIWSYHHLLLDGWSLGIVHRDLLQANRALAAGEPIVWTMASPYRDYVGWLARRDHPASRAFWAGYLADYDQPATVARLGGGADGTRFEPAEHTLDLGAKMSGEVRALAARAGVTLNILFQAAWGLVLARHNRTEDVVFGAVVSGRPADLPGVEEMVGLFICTVPVRVRPVAGSSWLALLRELQAHALAAEAHHHFPLGEIQALTALGRELFDHLLVFENYPLNRAGTEAAAGGLRVEELQAHDRTHYNLDLTVDPGESIAIKFGYNRSIYGGEQIVRVAGHLRRVLEQALARPEAALGDLALLTPAETRIVLETFNATALAWPQDRTVVDLIEEVAARVPAATAVVHGATRLTYRELEARANQLAHLLQRRGVGPEVVVGLCVERSVDMITGVLGIWKAGGAYVPLDPLYPAERLAFMVRDAGVRVLVTQAALRDRLPPGDTDHVWIDGEEIAAAPTSSVGPGLRPENLAYLIYTSGSTGRPKGVLVEHRSLVNLAVAGRIAYGLKEDAVRLLQVASLSFDVFASDCLRALTNGGTLVICDAEERLDPAAMCDMLQRHRITLLESTPGLILPLMAHVRARRVTLPDLRVLVIGSDTLAAPEYRRLVADFGATVRILNGYGVTEATIDTCIFEESENVPATGATPIGRPMANMRLYVLDAAMRACPIGVAGELFIGGAGLARGYHARPELTAERFVQVSLGGGRQRLYRTGDLARWRADGNVEFLGRGDQQVKVRGFRVEPGEIEARLRTHPAVRETVVLARAVGGDHALVAYVVAAGEWSPAELRRHVQAELPEHMIPTHWVPLGQLPLSPNGKIDRRALPAPEAIVDPRDGNDVAPRSALEETLAAIWCDVLQVPRVGREDDFFTLGGHSLKAMQVASRVEQAFGVRPGLRAFFARPTIAGLAALVAQGAGSVGREPAIAPAPVQEYYPLSHAQERLWLLHQLGGAAAYNMPEAYVLERDLDAATLERALQQLVARHEALRTAFVLINGEPRQKILPELSIVLGRIDLSADPQAEAKAREIAEAEAARPFDLAQPPLLRATLVTLGPRRAVFLFTMHHVIGDGWSGNLLYREVFALYAAARRGEPDPLPPLKIHYKDFAVWQRARGFDRDEDYWLRQLRGVPETLALPYDFTPKPDRDFRGGMEAAAIDAAVAGQLRRLARERRTTVANVVLAVFELVLFQLTKQEDFCVGLSSASRNRPELENLIGFFVNILPVRAQLREAMEFDELLAQVTAAAEEAFEHQEYPFDLLVQKVNPRRFRNRQPLLNVIFAFQNFSDVHLDIGSTAADAREAVDELTPARAFEQAFKTSKFDLTLFVVDEGKEIPLALEYDTGLFRAETIRRYLALLQRFAAMVAQAGGT